jgi:hypothetical protein
MVDSLSPVTELGFAEFTAGLINQTLEAVISAYADQERKLLEIRRVAALSPEAYVDELKTSLGIEEAIARQFPPPKGSLGSTIDAGSGYVPASEGQAEKPAIAQLTGYRMVANRDYRRQSGSFVITSAGYDNIWRAVALELAKAQLSFIQGMATKGFPRVFVDHGRVSSKLVFKLYEQEVSGATSSPAILPGIPLSSTPLKRFMVAPVHAKGPEYLSLKADIVGEVEITFKTIME